MMGIILIYYYCQSVDFSVIFALIPFLQKQAITILTYDFPIIDLICFFILIGSVGKSAQIGLHT
jgi:NADH:ubiquinone oxidoreductase subunit 5 (subunit L)/multisubunit Na+/H+ antiporter MnhA subunit